MELDINFEEDEWLEELLEKEKEMDMFYETNVSNVHLYFLYLDKNNNIIYIKKNNYDVTNSVILKNDIIKLIKNNDICLKQQYSLNALLQYNFSLNIENLSNFMLNPKTFNFFKPIKSIYDIHWKKTISHFNSINSLYFIFKKKPNTLDKTKKIYISRNRGNKKHGNKKRKNKTMKKRPTDSLIIKETDIIKLN
jgi:hypothetical protein